MAYTWDFSVIAANKTAILNGTLLTLELTVLSIAIGTLLGIVLALLKLSKQSLPKYLAVIFIEIFQGLPVLVLLIWLFYVLPIGLGVRIGAFESAVIGLSLNLGAFSAEIFRAGIQAVPKGQIEAATSLGLNPTQTLRRIVLPQAVSIIAPALSGRYIETIKLTSLASVIAVNELLHAGQNLISVSFRPLEVYTVIALIYLAIIIPLTMALRRIERKAA